MDVMCQILWIEIESVEVIAVQAIHTEGVTRTMRAAAWQQEK